jgi:hypothetical protein
MFGRVRIQVSGFPPTGSVPCPAAPTDGPARLPLRHLVARHLLGVANIRAVLVPVVAMPAATERFIACNPIHRVLARIPTRDVPLCSLRCVAVKAQEPRLCPAPSAFVATRLSGWWHALSLRRAGGGRPRPSKTQGLPPELSRSQRSPPIRQGQRRHQPRIWRPVPGNHLSLPEFFSTAFRLDRHWAARSGLPQAS